MKKFNGVDYFYNDAAMNIQVGTILRRANRWSTNLLQVGDVFRELNRNRNNYTVVGNSQDHVIYSQETVTLNLGANVGGYLAAVEASIGFKSKNTGLVIIKDGITTDLLIDQFQADLERIWYDRPTRYVDDSNHVFLVTSVIATNRAKIFYSNQNKTSVKLQSNLPINNGIDLLSAGFVKRNVSSVITTDIHNQCALLINVVRWRNKRDRFVPFF
jgi:hypothetical protein